MKECNNEIRALGDSLSLPELLKTAHDIKFSPSDVHGYGDFLGLYKKASLFYLADSTALAIHTLNDGLEDQNIEDYESAIFLETKGNWLNHINQVKEALECYIKAANLYEKLEMKTNLASINYKIGNINYASKNLILAKTYLKKSIAAMEALKNPNDEQIRVLRNSWNSLGLVYRRAESYDSAIQAFKESYAYADKMGNHFWKGLTTGNIGAIYQAMGEYQKALENLEEDFKISAESGNYESALNAGLDITQLYLSRDMLAEAQSWFDRVNKIKSEVHALNSLMAYHQVAGELDEKLGNYKLAVEEFHQYDHLKDSLNATLDKSELNNLQERYRLEKELTQLKILKKNNELQQQQLRLRTILIFCVLLVLTFLIIYIYTMWKKNSRIHRLNETLEEKVQERTEKLNTLNKELDTYLYRASHDIRRPISTILGLKNLSLHSQDALDMEQIFEKVQETAQSMDNMLFKLQMAYELNKLDTVEFLNLPDFIEEILQKFHPQVMSRMIKHNVILPKEAQILTVPRLLFILLENVIENAIIHNERKKGEAELNIFCDLRKEGPYIEISDNGPGIQHEFQERVFEAYFRINPQAHGSGLGLYLAKKAADKLGATFSLHSEQGKGTRIIIILAQS